MRHSSAAIIEMKVIPVYTSWRIWISKEIITYRKKAAITHVSSYNAIFLLIEQAIRCLVFVERLMDFSRNHMHVGNDVRMWKIVTLIIIKIAGQLV